MIRKSLLVAISCMLLTGCATIINEKTQKVNIVTSTGKKAKIQIDGMPFEAPGIATVTRAKADKVITSSNPKCNSTTMVPSSVDTVFWINILVPGGLLSSTTDFATEKMWKYQDTVIVSCQG